jgi:hypothetical protein
LHSIDEEKGLKKPEEMCLKQTGMASIWFKKGSVTICASKQTSCLLRFSYRILKPIKMLFISVP